jgi:hypothetical protein
MVDAKQTYPPNGSKGTRKDIVDVLRSKESDLSCDARRTLLFSAAFGLIASACAWMTLRGFRNLKATAKDHAQWKHEDKKLDDAIESSLDASDAVAKY